MQTRKKSNRIDRRAGNQGSRPPGRNQPGIEKSATGINSSENALQGNQNQGIPNTEPVVIATNQPPKAKRTKWTKEEYKIVLQAFYKALSNPNTHTTQQTYMEWRIIVGPEIRD